MNKTTINDHESSDDEFTLIDLGRTTEKAEERPADDSTEGKAANDNKGAESSRSEKDGMSYSEEDEDLSYLDTVSIRIIGKLRVKRQKFIDHLGPLYEKQAQSNQMAAESRFKITSLEHQLEEMTLEVDSDEDEKAELKGKGILKKKLSSEKCRLNEITKKSESSLEVIEAMELVKSTLEKRIQDQKARRNVVPPGPLIPRSEDPSDKDQNDENRVTEMTFILVKKPPSSDDEESDDEDSDDENSDDEDEFVAQDESEDEDETEDSDDEDVSDCDSYVKLPVDDYDDEYSTDDSSSPLL